jgi:predicted transposase/invertase (TIGR01784 family)
MERILLSPRNDIAFKKLFGTKEHRKLLMSFLNSVLELKDKQTIVSVKIRNNDLIVEVVQQKECFLDIWVEDASGKQYIIEMQVAKEDAYLKRILYYTSRTYTQELSQNEEYAKLKPVVSLSILNHVLFSDNKDVKSTHMILDKKRQINYVSDFLFVFIELPKFKTKVGDLKTIEDLWCYFLKNAEKMSLADQQNVIDRFPDAKEAFETLDQHSWTGIEISAYKRKQREQAVVINNMRAIKAEGEAKGLAKGIEVGKAEGKVEGKKEMQIESAIDSLAAGISVEIISKITKLSIDEILKLKSK